MGVFMSLKAECLSLLLLANAVVGQDFFFLDGEENPLIGYSAPFKVTAGDNNCTTLIRNFNPQIHKPKYVVGVFNPEGDEAARNMYNLTFGKYLTATAGRKFDPPIEFDIATLTMTEMMQRVSDETVDFTFASSAVSSCMATEYDAQPLVTVISRREIRGFEYELDLYGGVIFTLASNKDVNSIHDLKDRTIGLGGITMMGGGQAQLNELVKNGVSYVSDPLQMVFTNDEVKTVQGVLDGLFEIGMARTDQIERHLDAKGEHLDPDTFKIINAQTHLLENGQLFPFVSSTSLHPEWPTTALPHVAADVAGAVQEALLALHDHAMALKIGMNLRCETTPELAELASDAKHYGTHSGFRPARNYFSVRTKQERAGIINMDEDGNPHCIKGETLYNDIACPPEYFKIQQNLFNNSCALVGLECPREDFECYCKPCVHKSIAVDVFQVVKDGQYKSAFEVMSSATKPCENMKVCGKVEQTKQMTFRIVDKMERAGAAVTARYQQFDEMKDLQVYEVDGEPSVYEFNFVEQSTGVVIVEVAFDNIEIYDSPFRLEVVSKICPNEKMVPTEEGNCICKGGTTDVYGECVESAVFAIVGSILGLMLVMILVYAYVSYKNHKADEMWKINVEELVFDDPVEVIGQGSFGIVLLAEYRGTKVAIKQAVKGRKGGSTKGAHKSRSSFGRSSLKQPTTAGPTREIATSTDDMASQISGDSDDRESKITTDSSDTADVEAGNVDAASVDLSRKYSGALSLNFLGATGLGNRKGGWWAQLVPWTKRQDYESRFKETILGSVSASATEKSWREICCPWFNEHYKRQQEFVREMRVLSLLRHPCITTVMGAVHTRGSVPMLVMEYMEYGSLHELLRNETMYLGGDVILQMLRSVGQGLRYLHSSRPPILHGDLKARNILIDSRFRAKLCDFGLSGKQSGQITGTPFWLAPEYLRGETDYDTKCDIYSVGIILYEIYARSNPYEGEDFKEVLRRVCDKRINKRPAIPPTTPPKVVDLMKKCWNRDRNFRPTSRDLDMTLMDFNTSDAEPLTEEQTTADSKRRRTGDMLYELFPQHIADALKEGKKVEPENHDLVTIVFSDIVHFTAISQQMDPIKVSRMLDNLYVAFDKIAQRHCVFKVETIGDAYMGVTNLGNKQEHNHAKAAAEFAIDMIEEARKILIDEDEPEKGYINIRVGFHSGPVVSNVIGSLNPRYGLFGDTVNTASRMESNSTANRILCSERSHQLLREQAPHLRSKKRGKIAVKGKGDMTTYWVSNSHRSKMEERPSEDQLELPKNNMAVVETPTKVKRVEFHEEPSESLHRQ